jgi:hypothetical protein
VIKYSLVCDNEHQFESWFANSAAYDKQAKRKLVACPVCNSTKVEKALMAPRLGAAAKKRAVAETAPAPAAKAPDAGEATPMAIVSPQEREFRAKLKELRDHLVKNSDNVGKEFPQVARKMHYGEIEHRSIYGEASPEDATEMIEEGIELHPLPILPEDRN